MEIYLCFAQQQHGPFSLDQVRAFWHSQELPSDALYWCEGMRSWTPVTEFQTPSELKVKPESVLLSTAPQIANRLVQIEREIITAECVFGLNMFRDWLAQGSVMGGRNDSTQNELRKARMTCLRELKREAAELGADAVIGVDLDYSELTGHGKALLFLVASGTAVKLQPIPPPLP